MDYEVVIRQLEERYLNARPFRVDLEEMRESLRRQREAMARSDEVFRAKMREIDEKLNRLIRRRPPRE